MIWRPVRPARPLAGYVGGKRALAPILIQRIEAIPHTLYAEPFVGLGGVFLRRPHAPAVEAINDLNRDVATLFRILQNHQQAFLDMFKWQLASRAEWERLKGLDPDHLTDLQRAARFLYLQSLSYGGKVAGRNFGIDPASPARFNLQTLAPAIADVHERLAGVWIECLPWRDFVDRWDRPDALFYLDPPYFGTESYYGADAFRPDEHAAIADRLRRLKGRFILSINDAPEIRRIYDGFVLEERRLTYTVNGSAPSAAQELIISDRRGGSGLFDAA